MYNLIPEEKRFSFAKNEVLKSNLVITNSVNKKHPVNYTSAL